MSGVPRDQFEKSIRPWPSRGRWRTVVKPDGRQMLGMRQNGGVRGLTADICPPGEGVEGWLKGIRWSGPPLASSDENNLFCFISPSTMHTLQSRALLRLGTWIFGKKNETANCIVIRRVQSILICCFNVVIYVNRSRTPRRDLARRAGRAGGDRVRRFLGKPDYRRKRSAHIIIIIIIILVAGILCTLRNVDRLCWRNLEPVDTS